MIGLQSSSGKHTHFLIFSLFKLQSEIPCLKLQSANTYSITHFLKLREP